MLLPLSAESQQPKIPIRDWDQLDFGISPIVPLGSVPMSDWDQSQLDIGISPNVRLGSIPIGYWDQSQSDFFLLTLAYANVHSLSPILFQDFVLSPKRFTHNI